MPKFTMTDAEKKRADQIRRSLRAFMDDRDLSEKGWATAAGLSDRALGMFMAGKSRSPQNRTFEKLAAAQNVTVEYLLGYGATIATGEKQPSFKGELAPDDIVNLQLIAQRLQRLEKLQEQQNETMQQILQVLRAIAESNTKDSAAA